MVFKGSLIRYLGGYIEIPKELLGRLFTGVFRELFRRLFAGALRGVFMGVLRGIFGGS